MTEIRYWHLIGANSTHLAHEVVGHFDFSDLLAPDLFLRGPLKVQDQHI